MSVKNEDLPQSITTMPALIYSGPSKSLQLARRPVPRLVRDSDVLVRVVATGICGTDRGIVMGTFPAVDGVILGHEAVGIVEEVGKSVSSLQTGDRVVINPTYACGECRQCRRDAAAYCSGKEGREVGVDCDGAMAGFILLPETSILRIPDEMSFRRATQIEPLACVLNNLSAIAPRHGDRIFVFGAGPIGTLCAYVLATRGFHVHIVEKDERRADIARDALDALTPSHVAVSIAPPNGERPDVIIESVGWLLEEALGLIGEGGTVLIMGAREGVEARVPLRPLVTRGVRIVGAGPYSPQDFELAAQLAQDLPLERFITDEAPLERFVDAFGMLAAGPESTGGYRALKVLLVSDERSLS